jgi:hypothetical protein
VPAFAVTVELDLPQLADVKDSDTKNKFSYPTNACRAASSRLSPENPISCSVLSKDLLTRTADPPYVELNFLNEKAAAAPPYVSNNAGVGAGVPPPVNLFQRLMNIPII